MRKNFGAKPWTYPQPVFILATYNEDGTPDGSELLRMRTYYHEEKVTVKLNSNDDVNLTRLNITTGLSYYF